MQVGNAANEGKARGKFLQALLGKPPSTKVIFFGLALSPTNGDKVAMCWNKPMY